MKAHYPDFDTDDSPSNRTSRDDSEIVARTAVSDYQTLKENITNS
jgi:hypothetical protein